jgi:hypothetical protein
MPIIAAAAEKRGLWPRSALGGETAHTDGWSVNAKLGKTGSSRALRLTLRDLLEVARCGVRRAC